MRLTENMIIARSKQSDLSTIKRINLWGCDLDDISIVKHMTNVEVLALSINKLSCLQPLQACTKLQTLYLRKNNISDFSELKHLQKLPALTDLWLGENPCAERAGASYRASVIRMLPQLKKLDDEEITTADVEESMKLKSARLESESSPVGVCMEPQVSPKREPETVETTTPIPEPIKAEPLLETEIISMLQQQMQSPRELKLPLPEEATRPLKQQELMQPEPPNKFPVMQELETERSRHSLPLSFAPCADEPPQEAQQPSKTQSLNQIPQLKLVLQIQPSQQGTADHPRNLEHSDQESSRNRTDSCSERASSVNRNVNLVRLEQGSFTSRTRASQGLQQDSGWESFSCTNREMGSQKMQRHHTSLDGSQAHRTGNHNEHPSWEDDYQTCRSNATRTSTGTSTLYHSKSAQRSANVFSALLYMLPELDIESLQVMEHSIQCRLDEMSDQ